MNLATGPSKSFLPPQFNFLFLGLPTVQCTCTTFFHINGLLYTLLSFDLNWHKLHACVIFGLKKENFQFFLFSTYVWMVTKQFVLKFGFVYKQVVLKFGFFTGAWMTCFSAALGHTRLNITRSTLLHLLITKPYQLQGRDIVSIQ